MGSREDVTEKKEWFEGIQSLRAILCILVILSHSGSFFEVDGVWGACAVEVFFVLSGFLGASGYRRKCSVWKEGITAFWKKYLEFWPLHLIMFAFAVPVEQNITVGKMIANFFMFQSYLGDARAALSFNWISWFSSSILICFLFSPILNRIQLYLKKKCVFVIVLLFVFQIIWAYLWKDSVGEYGIGYYYVYIFPLIRMIDYFQGILFYSVYNNFIKKNNLLNYDMVESIVIMIFLIMINMVGYVPEVFKITVIWLPVSFGLIWIFSAKRGKITKELTNLTCLKKIGLLSFEIYVIHRMVFVYANFFWGNSLFSWISALIFIVIAADMASSVLGKIKLSWKKDKSNIDRGL